uniref:Uncharacterized protein n=1 Tax=Meloidogyne enterolobii TaxID=390850 RepID=A0A6V7VAE9_MELEN|nr:unnamed protein product [Meloidogyne enterolobii]
MGRQILDKKDFSFENFQNSNLMIHNKICSKSTTYYPYYYSTTIPTAINKFKKIPSANYHIFFCYFYCQSAVIPQFSIY